MQKNKNFLFAHLHFYQNFLFLATVSKLWQKSCSSFMWYIAYCLMISTKKMRHHFQKNAFVGLPKFYMHFPISICGSTKNLKKSRPTNAFDLQMQISWKSLILKNHRPTNANRPKWPNPQMQIGRPTKIFFINAY